MRDTSRQPRERSFTTMFPVRQGSTTVLLGHERTICLTTISLAFMVAVIMNVVDQRHSSYRLIVSVIGITSAIICAGTLLKRSHHRGGTAQTRPDEEPSAVAIPYHNRNDWPRDLISNSTQRIDHTIPTASRGGGPADSHFGNTDPKVELAEVIARLERSGPGTGTLNGPASKVFDTWKHDSPLGSKVAFSDLRCYADGCSIVARYSDPRVYFDASHDFEMSEAFLMWPRPKFRSGPIQDSAGNVEATWVLYR